GRSRGAELLDERAAVELDDLLDVGRPLAERGENGRHELVLAGGPERSVVYALEADRRAGLVVDRRAPAQRASEVTGPHLDLVGEGEEPLVDRAVDARRSRAGVDG